MNIPADNSAKPWERAISACAAVTIVGLVGFLVIRNQPFSDPNLVVFVRIMLSFATALLGATIPGTLRVSWSGKGLAIRAAGAVSLFVITLFFTPAALSPTRQPTQTGSTHYTRLGFAIDDASQNIHVAADDRIELSPYKIYFGSYYDRQSGLHEPDYKETPAVKEAVVRSAQWIAGFDGSVKCVIVTSNIDVEHSTEYALALSARGSEIVKNLLIEGGINGNLIYPLANGNIRANPVFHASTDNLKQNFNNSVSIAVVFKSRS
jgi:hypothetical protein